MSKEKEFEKIWLFLKNTCYDEANVAIANCPNDWSMCSFVMSAWHRGKQRFAALDMDRGETVRIRDALTSVIDDMPYAKTKTLNQIRKEHDMPGVPGLNIVGLKRYGRRIIFKLDNLAVTQNPIDNLCIENYEDPDGGWYKREDVEKLIKEALK